MLTPCQSLLEEARDLLEHGLFGDGVDGLVRLRRCAHKGICREWCDCRAQIDLAWTGRTAGGLAEIPPGRVARH
ncbi:MAG TPA: hypothetical protein VFZ01_20045 [Geminicoccaceae bacterium]